MTAWTQEEERLTENLSYVELLGEMNLTEAWVEDFQHWIQEQHHGQNTIKLLHWLTLTYPTCTAVYMVLQGIYGYQEGDYWSYLFKKQEMSAKNQQFLGQFFEQFLEKHHLPCFREEGSRYIANILVHGGIPDYSLEDFFSSVLEPALNRPHIFGLDGQEVILYWLSKNFSQNVDRPIRRFLQYGGKLAADFVSRCLMLARSTQTNAPGNGENSGLPERIVQAYQVWSGKHTIAQQTTRMRLRSPLVQLDPWAGALHFYFPAQSLGSDKPMENCRWTIQRGKREGKIFPVDVYFQDGQWETDAWSQEITHASELYEVTFEFLDQKRTWTFQSMRAGTCCFSFDADTGTILPVRSGLLKRRVWLMYPRSLQLIVEGGGKSEEFARPSEPWADYRLEEWDLRQAQKVILDQTEIPLEPDWASSQPYIRGNELPELVFHHAEPRIFIGTLPELCLPLSHQRSEKAEMSRWQLILREQHTSNSQIVKLEHCPYSLQEQTLIVCLEECEDLNIQFAQSYELVIRGPLGRDAHFTFAVFGQFGLKIREQDRLRIPNRLGIYPEPFLEIEINKYLSVASEQKGVQLNKRAGNRYDVELPAQETSLSLLVHRAKQGGEQHQVPLIFPFPVLQWALVDEQHAQKADWKSKPLTVSFAQLEQMERPLLIVACFPVETAQVMPDSKLTIAYHSREEPQCLLSRGKLNGRSLFYLAAIMDSLRASDSAAVEIKLTLGEKRTLPIAHVTHTLGIQKLLLDSIRVDNLWLLEASWQSEGRAIRQKLLRFWSLGRPWTQAYTVAIPDQLSAELYQFEAKVEHLLPGPYRLEMTVASTNLFQEAQRPLAHTVDWYDIALGSEEEQRAYLAGLPDSVEGNLERLAVIPFTNEIAQDKLCDTLTRQLQQTGQQYTWHIAALLLRLVEDFDFSHYDSHPLFMLAKHYLHLFPIEMLAFIARVSRYSEGEKRWHFEELFVKIIQLPRIETLLRQIQQRDRLALAELLAFFPHLKDQEEQFNASAILQDAGITIVDHEQREWGGELDDESVKLFDNSFSERSLEGLRQYFYDIGQYSLLTASQERQYARQIIAGQEAAHILKQEEKVSKYLLEQIERGKQARDQLVNHNLRLVVNLAKKYPPSRIRDLQDVIQEGNLGLIRACDKFDPEKGYRFSTYATWWIQQAIKRGLAEKDRLVRLPVYLHDDVMALRRIRRELWQTYEREPTLEELAAQSNQPRNKVIMMLEVDQEVSSLDAPLSLEEGYSLGDLVEAPEGDPQDRIGEIMRKEMIEQMLSELPGRERHILEARFGLLDGKEKTLQEVGDELQVTRERIRQIEARACKRLLERYSLDYSSYI